MLTIILVSVLVSVRGYYSNGQARECIDNIAINEKCLKELHECFSEGSCSSEYKQYEKCTIDEDNNIFNGYCFREWAENAITTKPVIDCLVRECNLIYNSQYNIVMRNAWKTWDRLKVVYRLNHMMNVTILIMESFTILKP
jgi:hypothetical protein